MIDERAIPDQRLGTGDQRRETDDRRQETDDLRPETDDRRQETDDRHPQAYRHIADTSSITLAPAHQSPSTAVQAFTYHEFDGQAITGQPDEKLFDEAINRFKHARVALRGQDLTLLEFPFSTHKHVRPSYNNVVVKYDASVASYEIKVFKLGLYNARKLTGHFILTPPHKPEISYDMTVS